ncbi:hypothetical protein [Halomarina pelagica]|uniref:hypothetical protein n=1 Tax=Halomarina pelagica TaxID=2961599 RepID=UPI0020C31D4B|nr:hypothetical protein [Halomarina sp. BND7]
MVPRTFVAGFILGAAATFFALGLLGVHLDDHDVETAPDNLVTVEVGDGSGNVFPSPDAR